MKKHVLLTRIGMRITAAMLSSALFVTAPSVSAFAAEGTTGETAQAASTEPQEEEKEEEKKEEKKEEAPSEGQSESNPSEGQSESKGGSEESDNGGTEENSDPGESDEPGSGSDAGSSREDSGAGDTGEKESPGNEDTGETAAEEKAEENGSASDTGKTENSREERTKDTSSDSATDGNNSPDRSSSDGNTASTAKTSSETGSSTADSKASDNAADTSTSTVPQNPAPVTSPVTSKEQANTGTTVEQVDAGTTAIAVETVKDDKKAKDLKEKKTELNPDETPTGYDQALNHTGTNEQLIASQNIISGLSIMQDDFRFHTINKDLAFSRKVQDIHEEMDGTSRQVGTLLKNDALYILNNENNGWLYVESGDARGFVREDDILVGVDANVAFSKIQVKVNMLKEKTGETHRIENFLHFATESVPANENKAYAYMRCSTKPTVVSKDYAVAKEELPIMEEADSSSREVGCLRAGNLAYIITHVNSEWMYIESGISRGFIPKAGVTTGQEAKAIVKERGEARMGVARTYIKPKDNKALYYTLTSVNNGITSNNIRKEIVKTASEYIGNPYVWGGTSLTNGADCSGFVQTLYSMFGYSIPRVADAQSEYGTQIPVSDAAPGDLVFFAANGYVYHVALYAGDGMTIEAYSEDRGIIATQLGNRDAVWATRIIPD